MTDGGRQHMQMSSVHRPNKTKPVEPTSRLWAHVGGVDIPLQACPSLDAGGSLRMKVVEVATG